MTFKIERLVGRENEIVLRVCGGMQIECVNTLKELIKPENTKIVLDLSDVTLADRDAAMFLVVCDSKVSSSGIALLFFESGLPKNRRTLRRSFAEAVPVWDARLVATTRDHFKIRGQTLKDT